jgi:hypothetical protein
MLNAAAIKTGAKATEKPARPNKSFTEDITPLEIAALF